MVPPAHGIAADLARFWSRLNIHTPWFSRKYNKFFALFYFGVFISGCFGLALNLFDKDMELCTWNTSENVKIVQCALCKNI
jgi:hypothetical protein